MSTVLWTCSRARRMPVTAASTGLQVGKRSGTWNPLVKTTPALTADRNSSAFLCTLPNDARATMLLAKLWNTAVDGPAARILATSVAIYINK